MSAKDPDDGAPLPEPWFIREIREKSASAEPQGQPAQPDARLGPARSGDDHVLHRDDAVPDPTEVELPRDRVPPRLTWWPYAAGAALAAIVVLALWLTAVPKAGGAASQPPVVAEASPSAAVPQTADPVVAGQSAALECARPETIDRLRALVASRARASSGNARGDSLAQLLSLSVVGASDPAGAGPAFRCSGWLSLAATGVERLDPVAVSYRVLRSEDGSPEVSSLEGAEPVVAAIVAGAGRVDAPQAPMAEVSEPQDVPRDVQADEVDEPVRFSNPSFDCRRVTSQVNRMICASDQLAALDRETSDLFYATRDRADPATRDELEDSRDEFLARRQRCSSEACIARAYQERIAELEDYR